MSKKSDSKATPLELRKPDISIPVDIANGLRDALVEAVDVIGDAEWRGSKKAERALKKYAAELRKAR